MDAENNSGKDQQPDGQNAAPEELQPQESKKKAPRRRGFVHRWVAHPMGALLRITILVVIGTSLMLYLFYRANREEVLMVFSDWVKSQTVRLFSVEVTFTELETVNLGHFVLHDLQIHDPFVPDSLFLGVERAEVRLDPLHLIGRGGVNLGSVELYNGRVWVHREQNGDGPVNIERLFKPGSGGSGDGTIVRISTGLLQDVHVRLEDLDDDIIDNQVNYAECSFTRIAGENVIEVHGSSIATSYWNLGSVKVTGIYTIDEGVLSMRNARLIKGSTDLSGDGFVDFRNRVYDFTISPGKLELDHLPPELAMQDYLEGTVRVSAEITGQFDSAAIHSDIELDGGELFTFPVRDLSCELNYTGGTLSFDKIAMAVWGGRILEASTEFRFGGERDGYSVYADVRDVDITRLNIEPLTKVSGRISGRFKLEGRGYDPDSMELSGESLQAWGRFQEFAIDSAGVAFHYADSKVRIDRLAIYSGPAAATAIGDVEDWELFLFVIVEDFPLEQGEPYLPLDSLGGSGAFSGTLTGELGDPELKGTFTVSNGSWRQLMFANLEGDCRLVHMLDSVSGEVNLDFHDMDYYGVKLDSAAVNGVVPDPFTFEFRPLVLTIDENMSVYTEGSYSVPENGAGPDDPITMALDTLSALFYEHQVNATTAFDVYFNGDTTLIPAAEFDLLGGRVSGYARYTGLQWGEGTVKFSGLDLSRIPSVMPDQPPLAGQLSGSMDLYGNMTNPEGRLKAAVENLAVSIFSIKHVEAESHLVDKRLLVDKLLLVADSSSSTLSGELPFAMFAQPADTAAWMNELLAIHAELEDLPLSSINSPSLPLRAGKLNGAIDLSGTAASPQLEGELMVTGGSGVIAPINLRLQQVKGRVSFSPGSVTLDSLTSTSPEGQIAVSGRMSLAGLKPDSLQLHITGRDMVLQQFKYVTSIRVDADLEASGPVSRPMIAGRVHVVQGEINPLLGSGVDMTGSDNLSADSQVRLPVSPVDYDIRFTTSDDFWLRNRNANIKLSADIRATQQDSVPSISGSINAAAGTYSLFGRRFRIRYGSILFQGQPELNPRLDIEAERTVRGQVLRTDLIGGSFVSRGSSGPSLPGEQYEVDRNTFILHIGGTMNSPQFDITVRDREDRAIDPPLTEEQARTLVIMDQTWREFQQQSTYSQTKLLDQAANMALNQANPYLQEWTGLDELSFESQLFNPATDDVGSNGSERSAKITMGEFLFENVFFSISQDIIDPSARSAQIEYLVNRHSSIISQTDSRGHFSIDYRYRIRY